MGSPFEHREVMKAAMRYNEERTVEQVLAERARARAESESKMAEMRKRGSAGSKIPSAPALSSVPKSEMDKLRDMLANAPARPAPIQELDSSPDE